MIRRLSANAWVRLLGPLLVIGVLLVAWSVGRSLLGVIS